MSMSLSLTRKAKLNALLCSDVLVHDKRPWIVVEVNNSESNSEQHRQHQQEMSGGGEEQEHASKKRVFPEEKRVNECASPENKKRGVQQGMVLQEARMQLEACGGNVMGCDDDDTDDIVQHFRDSTSSSHHEARFLALLQNYTWEYNEVRKLRMKPTVVKNGIAAAA